jgi:hypothetical protein
MSENSNSDNIKFISFDDLLTPLATGEYEVEPIIGIDVESMSRFVLTDYNLDPIFESSEVAYVGAYSTGLFETTTSSLVMESFAQTMAAVGTLLGDENTDKYSKPLLEYRFKRKGKTYGSNIRIVKYQNNAAVTDEKNPLNINIIDRTLLSELVVTKKTSNLLLPIINIVASGSDLVAYDIFDTVQLDQKANYLVQLTEKFHSLSTLKVYLENYPLTKKVICHIIYQLADVLAQINMVYDNFRQNNLVPEMIDIYFEAIDEEIFPKIKLSNFYLATNLKAPDQVNSVSDDIFASEDLDPTYSDMYQILNWLWNHHEPDIKSHNDIVSLFNDILPKKIRSDSTYLTADLWSKLDLATRRSLNADFIRKHKILASDAKNKQSNYPPASSLPEPVASMSRIRTDKDGIKIVTYTRNNPRDVRTSDKKSTSGDFNDNDDDDDDSQILDIIEQNEIDFEPVDDQPSDTPALTDVLEEMTSSEETDALQDSDEDNFNDSEIESDETTKSQDYDIGDNKMSSKKKSNNQDTDKHNSTRTVGAGKRNNLHDRQEKSSAKSLTGTRIIKRDTTPKSKQSKSNHPKTTYRQDRQIDYSDEDRYAGLETQSRVGYYGLGQQPSGQYNSLGNLLGANQPKPPGYDQYIEEMNKNAGYAAYGRPPQQQNLSAAPMSFQQQQQYSPNDMLARYMAAQQQQGGIYPGTVNPGGTLQQNPETFFQ